MNGIEIIDLARRTYLEELAQFVIAQGKQHPSGEAEVKTLHRDAPKLFGGHYRVDFIGQQDGQPVPVDLIPDRRMRLDKPLEGRSGAMQLRIEQLVWDDVLIRHDAPGDMAAVLKDWFVHWYDPGDQRQPAQADGVVDVIHALEVHPGGLVVDFGSAATGAFSALVTLLRDAGATRMVVSETRPPPPLPN